MSKKTVIGYCHPGEVNAGFHDSLVNLLRYDFATNRRIAGVISEASSANISGARNAIMRAFLASKADWLWMVDTDMTFYPDTVDALLSVAEPNLRPVVGGLCFGVNVTGETEAIFPTLYALSQSDDGQPRVVRYMDFPENTLMQVFGTGAACLLIHRSAALTIEARYPGPWPWFSETTLGEQIVGEDIHFCMKAAVCKVPIHVHTGIEVGHVKPRVVSLAAFRRAQAEDRPDVAVADRLDHGGEGADVPG